MKVKDTLELDKIYSTLLDRVRNFASDTPYMFTNRDEAVRIIKQYYPSWQYNGVADFDDIAMWCEEQFGHEWIWNFETFYFKNERDKTLFLLRWS